jgi:hypothetical protein
MRSWASSFGDGIYGDAAIVSARLELTSSESARRVQWQENKEKEIEKLQGNLFGEEEG